MLTHPADHFGLAACNTLASKAPHFAPRYRSSPILSQASILAVRPSSTVLHACDSVPSALHHTPFAPRGSFQLILYQSTESMAPALKGLEISKSCSACGKIKAREGFGKKQWAARAVRRCVACVESGVKVVFCDHGRGRDCAVCDAAAAASAAAAAAAHLDELAQAEEARLEKIRARPQRMLLRRVCDVCLRFFRERRLPVCGGCGKRRYCSVECQTQDWKLQHKDTCARWTNAAHGVVCIRKHINEQVVYYRCANWSDPDGANNIDDWDISKIICPSFKWQTTKWHLCEECFAMTCLVCNVANVRACDVCGLSRPGGETCCAKSIKVHCCEDCGLSYCDVCKVIESGCPGCRAASDSE